MLFQPGAASAQGFSVQTAGNNVIGTEFIDFVGCISLANNGTLKQGQVVCYDATNVPNSSGADKVVLPSSANAGVVYGVYQGLLFTNTTGATAYFPFQFRRAGYGCVLAQVTASSTGSTAITVGSYLIIGANGTSLPDAYEGSATAGVTVGMAVATGTNTSYGATILPGSTAATIVLNAMIKCI